MVIKRFLDIDEWLILDIQPISLERMRNAYWLIASALLFATPSVVEGQSFLSTLVYQDQVQQRGVESRDTYVYVSSILCDFPLFSFAGIEIFIISISLKGTESNTEETMSS